MSASIKIRRALLSVYDKTGLVEFARALHAEFGIELISTGGTAKALKDAGLPVTLVEEVTGFPEMLDGRVKTLHPKIHAAILADRDNPEHMRQLKEQGIEPIDMVVVNLYPFEHTIAKPDAKLSEKIEMIDIGGPCLLRAAAKNYDGVFVVDEPEWYEETLQKLRKRGGASSYSQRFTNAIGAFQKTASYDLVIYRYLSEFFEWLQKRESTDAEEPPSREPVPATAVLTLDRLDRTRYGENPHQDGSAWTIAGAAGLDHRMHEPTGEATVLGGRNIEGLEFSYNNFADASAALELCAELTRAKPGDATVCFIKHTNACGVAVDADAVEAYRRAYLGDPNAAMGGILAVSFAVTSSFAEAVMETYSRWGKAAGAGGFFVEVWLAPAFEEAAVNVIRTKKEWGQRVRLLAVGDMSAPPDSNEMDYKRIAGGMLVQTRDLVGLNEEQWKVVTQRPPTEAEIGDLRLAWLVCKHTKSNAITICKDGALIGNGAGQMSRVMSCRIATWLAQENKHADQLKGAVAASDAFFPFRDGPQILMDAGVSALIQPGGSKRDEDTIQACDERGVAMLFTGTRHFKH
jgi:phosphoribosylaminoimidazolecarboxamide formyltransferase/IMP cyclohydrolase